MDFGDEGSTQSGNGTVSSLGGSVQYDVDYSFPHQSYHQHGQLTENESYPTGLESGPPTPGRQSLNGPLPSGSSKVSHRIDLMMAELLPNFVELNDLLSEYGSVATISKHDMDMNSR